MKNFHSARFLAVVEQSRNFNYATAPRAIASLNIARSLPTSRSRKSTLDVIQRKVTSCLAAYLPDESSRLLVWLVDDEGKPVLFITGLLDVREGKLNRKQLTDWSEMLFPQITCEQSMTEVLITVWATARFLLCEDYDFDTDAYEGEGDNRDFDIAHDLVDEACNAMDEYDVCYVERDENHIVANADVTTNVTIQVPWNHANQLRKDQREYLRMEAKYALAQHVTAYEVRFSNVHVETILDGESVVI